MLLLGSFGLLFTFLLAIELSHEAKGAPAFLPPFLLLVSPLFYTQSMMAQLDMPAMVLTLLVLLLFIKQEYAWAALAAVCLVLVKETGIVVPFVAFLVFVWRREFCSRSLVHRPRVVLAGWLFVLHRATGYWLGDPGFAHYNVAYAFIRFAWLYRSRGAYLLFVFCRVSLDRHVDFARHDQEMPGSPYTRLGRHRRRDRPHAAIWSPCWAERSWNAICCRCSRSFI